LELEERGDLGSVLEVGERRCTNQKYRKVKIFASDIIYLFIDYNLYILLKFKKVKKIYKKKRRDEF